jgi:hypothetical protein
MADFVSDLSLYQADYPAWAKQAAPRWVVLMQAADDTELAWLCSIARDRLKREVWALADNELRQRIKTVVAKRGE